MMYELLLYSMILGLVFGGSLKKLWNTELQGFPLILVSVLSLAVSNWMRRSAFLSEILNCSVIESLSAIIYFLAFLILLIVVWINREEHTLLLVGIGIILNMLVIFTNGAKMPVDPLLAQAMGLTEKITHLDLHGFYAFAGPQTHFYILADVIKNPFLTSYIVSIGDFFISGGLFLFVLQKMKVKSIRILQK